MEIIGGGLAAAILFTVLLWRTRGSLYEAAKWVFIFGGLVMLLVLGMPTIIQILTGAHILADTIGKANPKLVIWGFVSIGLFLIILLAKPKED